MFDAPLRVVHALRRRWDRVFKFPPVRDDVIQHLPFADNATWRETMSLTIIKMMEKSPHWYKHYNWSDLHHEAVKITMDYIREE